MRTLLKSLIGIGAALLIGTAGASDNNSISFEQILLQMLFSLALIAVGYYGQKYTKPKQKRVLRINRHYRAELKHAA